MLTIKYYNNVHKLWTNVFFENKMYNCMILKPPTNATNMSANQQLNKIHQNKHIVHHITVSGDLRCINVAIVTDENI